MEDGLEIYGLQRPKPSKRSEQVTYPLKDLGLYNKINFCVVDLSNKKMIDSMLKEHQPKYFVHLGSQSSVKKSSGNKRYTNNSNLELSNIVNSIEENSKETILFFPSSATIFEGYKNKVVSEKTEPKPRTEYAKSKLQSQNLINHKILNNNLQLNTGIMFSHESEYRRPNFFSKKIVEFLVDYKKMNNKTLIVGDLSIKRDIGYAKEYVDAIYKILKNNKKTEYIVSSNVLYELSDMVKTCLNILEINFEVITDRGKVSYIDTKNNKKFITCENQEFRKHDLFGIKGDNSKIANELGWLPKLKLNDICKKMIKHEITKQERNDW